MWILKSEPHTWSWDDQRTQKTTHWDGVRNYQACNHLKKMALGDLAFFYHSGKEKSIVGVVKVTKTAYPDPSDETGRFVMVDVTYDHSVDMPLSLKEIKAHPHLQNLSLVKQSRLSVCPATVEEWHILWGLTHGRT